MGQTQNPNKMAERKHEPKLEMASPSPSSAVTPYALRCIFRSVVPVAPPRMLASVLAENMTDAQWKELIEAKRRREMMTSPFDRPPDELVLKIIDMTAWSVSAADDYNLTAYIDYLVDVLCMVSLRFKRLATDYTLWARPWSITVCARGDPERVEFIVQRCLNSGSRGMRLIGSLQELYPVLTSPRYNEYINPTARFPSWRFEVWPRREELYWDNDQFLQEF